MKWCLRDRIYGWGVLAILFILGMLGTLNGVAVAADADTIVLALERDQDNMDPHMHFQRVGIIMNINMYDSLLHKNTKLEYEPSLATSWQALDEFIRTGAYRGRLSKCLRTNLFIMLLGDDRKENHAF